MTVSVNGKNYLVIWLGSGKLTTRSLFGSSDSTCKKLINVLVHKTFRACTVRFIRKDEEWEQCCHWKWTGTTRHKLGRVTLR